MNSQEAIESGFKVSLHRSKTVSLKFNAITSSKLQIEVVYKSGYKWLQIMKISGILQTVLNIFIIQLLKLSHQSHQANKKKYHTSSLSYNAGYHFLSVSLP